MFRRGPRNLRFLLDQNVPESVANWLEKEGNDVLRVRDIMAADAKDPIVAQAAIEGKRILVSWDKDFGHQRFRQPRFADLRRVGFSCSPLDSVKRLNELKDILYFVLSRDGGPPVETKIASDKILIRDKAIST